MYNWLAEIVTAVNRELSSPSTSATLARCRNQQFLPQFHDFSENQFPALILPTTTRVITFRFVMDPDTSVSTDSPGPKSSRTQLKWTNDMEVAFIATMKSMQSAPTKTVPSGFTKEAYKRVAEIIKVKSMQPDLCDDIRMKNKLGALRNDWRTYVNLLNSGWPRLPNGVPTNTDAILETYYKEQDPNARKFRAAPLRHFEELTELFDPSQKELIASLTTAPTEMPAPRPSIHLPQSPYEPVTPQLLEHSSTPFYGEEGSHFAPEHTRAAPAPVNGNHSSRTPQPTSSKRPAEPSLASEAKRILLGAPSTRQVSQLETHMRARDLNNPNMSSVAAATALFTRTFQFLSVEARVAVVKRFLDQSTAEIFLHTDEEVRKALVADWVKQAGERS